jgi:hypothetical protein
VQTEDDARFVFLLVPAVLLTETLGRRRSPDARRDARDRETGALPRDRGPGRGLGRRLRDRRAHAARSGHRQELLGRLRLGGTPAEAAAGPDALVWVTDKERSLVHRVDPKRVVLVDSFAAGPGAYSLARVGGAMWITSFAGADIRRYH